MLGKKCIPHVRPSPWPSHTSAFSRLGFRRTSWPNLTCLSPSSHVVPCPSGTHIPREDSGLAGAEGLASVPHNLMEVTLFWSQRQLFGGDVDPHPSSTVNLLCNFGQVNLPLRILVYLILSREKNTSISSCCTL